MDDHRNARYCEEQWFKIDGKVYVRRRWDGEEWQSPELTAFKDVPYVRLASPEAERA